MTAPLLAIENLSISFGGLKALTDFELELGAGDLHGLIGPNGAGKTTVFNLLTGVYRTETGAITLDGRLINGLRPFEIAAAGMARTFQNIRLFPNLSVIDNIKVACHLRTRHTMWGALFSSRASVGAERAITERALALLEIFSLGERTEELAANLPYGDQRRLEIARALATDPKVLLLDEPAAGMNPQEKKDLKALIGLVRERFGLSILLIEHDMGVVMDICERITVLDHGVTIASGSARDVQDNPKVIEAYLGAPDDGNDEDAGGARPS